MSFLSTVVRNFLLPACCVLLAMLPGCVTAPQPGAPGPVRFASITGSEEKSLLLDNFTAYIAAVDGRPMAAGRGNWDKPMALPAGHRRLTVEFKRGAFTARTDLEFDAAADTSYQLLFETDAELFGHNSYCDFWIVDLAAGRKVTAVKNVPVSKTQ